MSDEAFRRTCLHGLWVILIGLFIAGFPLTWIVTRDIYHQPIPLNPGGDYRSWHMAHLEGLLNGLTIIAIAAASRARAMTKGKERVLVVSLLIVAWGNVAASIAAPIMRVRAMAFNGDPINNTLVAIFTVSLVATLVAFFVVIRHLTGRIAVDQG